MTTERDDTRSDGDAAARAARDEAAARTAGREIRDWQRQRRWMIVALVVPLVAGVVVLGTWLVDGADPIGVEVDARVRRQLHGVESELGRRAREIIEEQQASVVAERLEEPVAERVADRLRRDSAWTAGVPAAELGRRIAELEAAQRRDAAALQRQAQRLDVLGGLVEPPGDHRTASDVDARVLRRLRELDDAMAALQEVTRRQREELDRLEARVESRRGPSSGETTRPDETPSLKDAIEDLRRRMSKQEQWRQDSMRRDREASGGDVSASDLRLVKEQLSRLEQRLTREERLSAEQLSDIRNLEDRMRDALRDRPGPR